MAGGDSASAVRHFLALELRLISSLKRNGIQITWNHWWPCSPLVSEEIPSIPDRVSSGIRVALIPGVRRRSEANDDLGSSASI